MKREEVRLPRVMDAQPVSISDKQKREWVEQEISIIRTEGRKVYKANTSDDFTAIWHDYESEDGFAVWKDRLHQVLDGDG